MPTSFNFRAICHKNLSALAPWIEHPRRFNRSPNYPADFLNHNQPVEIILQGGPIMRRSNLKALLALAVSALIFIGSGAALAAKPPGTTNGTTLQASKTVDVCANDDGSYTYSGVVSVWNEGALATQGLSIIDCVQNKVSGRVWTDNFCQQLNTSGTQIPAFTFEAGATLFPYSASNGLLPGDIRNSAKVTILNHSGSIGTPTGPNPKATRTGEIAPCEEACGCTFGQGYWGNTPGVVWPAPYDRNATFFLSGQTWQQVMDTPVGGNAYYNLAHQYIAAVLNVANGACEPSGVQDTIDLATAWFETNAPAACTPGSCGLQVTWAGILESYDQGTYPGGPSHCGA
jgi:hypothetical protein